MFMLIMMCVRCPIMHTFLISEIQKKKKLNESKTKQNKNSGKGNRSYYLLAMIFADVDVYFFYRTQPTRNNFVCFEFWFVSLFLMMFQLTFYRFSELYIHILVFFFVFFLLRILVELKSGNEMSRKWQLLFYYLKIVVFCRCFLFMWLYHARLRIM